MKKFLSLFMSVVMLMSFTVGLDWTANAEILTGDCGENGSNVTCSLDTESGVLTISGTGKMYDNESSPLDIPWKSDSPSVKTVIINSGVTSISKYAFSYCRNLTSITIPDSVTSIGYGALIECSSLTSITVDDNNQYYSSQDGVLFNKDKTNLIQYPIGNLRTSYKIPDSVISISEEAFYYCSSLTSVKIPNSVTGIGNLAFGFCSSLTEITVDSDNQCYSSHNGVLFNKNKTTLIKYPEGILKTSYEIPSSVTSIGDFAFCACNSLTSVTIPDSVTSIGFNAFSGCIGLTTITIPDSVTSLDDYVFWWCSDLTSVIIGNNVTSIGEWLFSCCTNLTSITIPNSVTSIGENAFSDCGSLTSVTIPDSVTSIGSYAFQGCSSLKDVYYTGTEEQWNSINVDSDNECLTDSTIHYNYHKHIYSDVVTPASCTAQGYTTHTCTICGDSYVDSYTNSIDHNFNNGKNCVVCGAVNLNYVEPTTAQPATTVKKPKSTSIKKLTKGKKQFKVIWKKISGVTGYQIQYSTSKKFTKAKTKTITVKDYKNTSKTIKKLKSKKTYYVRVRTYKTVKVNGKSTKAYSSWSKVKSVKTK